MPDNLFEYNGLTVDIENKPAEDVLKFLDENEYGTPGGIIYQHMYASEKAKMLKDTYFFTLRKNSRLLGNIAFVRRQLINTSKKIMAFYIRYLTVMPSYRRNLDEKKNTRQASNKGRGIIKESMQHFFQNAEKYFAGQPDEKYVFYAHIEDENQRSFLLSSNFGYEHVGRIETIIFSRLFPKRDKRLEKIGGKEKEKISEVLKEYYGDYSMYTSQNLFFKDNFFFFRENGEMTAGVQANVITWRIKDMPGLSGKLLLMTLPYLPLFSRLFNPNSFRFLAFESIYVKEGYEKELNKLFEAVCAEFRVPVALFFTDVNSRLNHTIKKYLHPGLFQRLNKKMTAGIYVKFINFSEKEKKEFASKPAYVSAFDLT